MCEPKIALKVQDGKHDSAFLGINCGTRSALAATGTREPSRNLDECSSCHIQ